MKALCGPLAVITPGHYTLHCCMTKLSTHVTAQTPVITNLRRDIHQHPELAFEEVRTASIVAHLLTEAGFTVQTGIGTTGVVGTLTTGKPGPTVLLRADFDALPVSEETGLEFASTTPGRMHACGHDAHTAILLGVARILGAERENLRGTIVTVFQPAEEIGEGAEAMLANGALTGITPDHVLGLHITSMHELGTVHVSAGPTMAATDTVHIDIHGQGGHAAMPPHFIDPVVTAAHVITALQTIVSRETDPLDQAVLSFGAIHGGTVANVIPEHVRVAGTLRTFSEETRTRLVSRITDIATNTAEAFRCTAQVRFTEGTPAVVNNEAAVKRFTEVAKERLGAHNVHSQTPMMGGDDMALWLQQAPGVYFWLGASSGETTSYAHHHPKFDIDERALPIGVELLTAAVLRLLEVTL